ncbi:MAG: penicillin-binding protein activator LpoB [Verrucomicrobiales bacterium]|nr:penicillin-binding protein activator LpoB [Verrucomicrobiales bacterium]
MNMQMNSWSVALSLVLIGIGTGCQTGVRNPSGVGVTVLQPDEQGFVAGTGIESQDLVRVANKMSRGILGVPEINGVQGVPRVVLDPVINETRFPINKDIFLTRIRVALNSQAAGKVRFLARSRMQALEREREMKRKGQVTSSTDPNANAFKGADFFLTGKLQSLTTSTQRGKSDYILYSFQLIDANTSDIVWEDFDEIKKQGVVDAVYR